VNANSPIIEYCIIEDIMTVNWPAYHPNGIITWGCPNGIFRYSTMRKGPHGYACGEGMFFEQSGGSTGWQIYGNTFEHLNYTGVKAIEVTSQVQTQDRSVVPGQGSAPPLSDAERKLNLAATELLPTDGLVKETAEDIVKGKKDDLAKARALYEWVVENTFRNPKTLGCGVGDITAMIKTGNLNGKCADLNALYVGMARSVGLPARDVYGIRVVPSQFGFKALGAGSENVTKAQHCRAEVWLPGSGWTPVDPADVRKVVLEEPPGNLAMADPKVAAARKTLFGSWEGNWVAFNDAHDVKLPGSKEPAIAFLMYPQAENKNGFLDSLDPDKFKYRITARELTS